MITEQDLQGAIAECEGQRNPNANTCIKLAAYHIIMDHLKKDSGDDLPIVPIRSYSSQSAESVIEYDSGTEFSGIANGMRINDLMALMDELMTTLQVVNPKLYKSVIRRMAE